MDGPMDAAFDRLGPAAPASPVVISVPHAGRDYPLALRAALRVPVAGIVGLEDRHVDQVALAARRAEIMLVQRLPRRLRLPSPERPMRARSG